MKQLLTVHGGEAFETYEEYIAWLRAMEVDIQYSSNAQWKAALPKMLGDEYQVISPRMPNSVNAKYSEWKIWFKKYLEQLSDGVILLGHSLGGIFLAQYLATTEISKRISGLLLAAAPFDAYPSVAAANFILPESLDLLQKQSPVIHIFHSTDDPEVPYGNAEKYKEVLPEAILHTFSDLGHFDMAEFPEVVEVIKSL